jgi:hypothetical protein
MITVKTFENELHEFVGDYCAEMTAVNGVVLLQIKRKVNEEVVAVFNGFDWYKVS